MNEQYTIDEIRQLENSLSRNPRDTNLMNKLAIGYLICIEADSFNKVDDLAEKEVALSKISNFVQNLHAKGISKEDIAEMTGLSEIEVENCLNH